MEGAYHQTGIAQMPPQQPDPGEWMLKPGDQVTQGPDDARLCLTLRLRFACS